MTLIETIFGERKGGMIQAIRELTVAFLIIFVLLLMVWISVIKKYESVKENYTALHHRVNKMEMMLNAE